MKLFLLSDTAVMTKGQNLSKVCVIRDGEMCKTNGVLTIGRATVIIEEGQGEIPPLNCGSVAVTFAEENGKTYDCGIVFFGAGGNVTANHNILESVLTEATKIDRLAQELAHIKDALISIEGRIDYKGLDFLLVPPTTEKR